jgi:hypothetical protein
MKKADIISFDLQRNIYSQRSSFSISWEDRFTIIDGYAPLLYIRQKFNHDPILLTIGKIYSRSLTAYDNFNICGSGLNMKIKTRKLLLPSYTYKNYCIFTGYNSVIGYNKQTYGCRGLQLSDTKSEKLTICSDKYDIFVLAVVDRNYLNRKKFDDSDTVKFNRKKVTLLVSNEKVWKNDKFMKEHYSPVLRKEIKKFLISAESGGYTIRVVPDSYLNDFIRSGVDLQTKSLTKVAEIERDVKNALFNNLNINSFQR